MNYDTLSIYTLIYSINTNYYKTNIVSIALTVTKQLIYKNRNFFRESLKHCLTTTTNRYIRSKTVSFTCVDLPCSQSSSAYTSHILFKSLQKTCPINLQINIVNAVFQHSLRHISLSFKCLYLYCKPYGISIYCIIMNTSICKIYIQSNNKNVKKKNIENKTNYLM